MLRIIGGEFRSRQLRSPKGSDITRPMAARVKESIFNLLRGWWEDAIVLDLYAGVGTMGLEAVSRGARFVLMVEQDRTTYSILKENFKSLNCGDRAETMLGDALSMVPLHRMPAPVTIMFVDPPYKRIREPASREAILTHISQCRSAMADKSFVVLRTPELADDVDLHIAGFTGPEIHQYGHDMQVLLYMPLLADEDQEANGEAPDR